MDHISRNFLICFSILVFFCLGDKEKCIGSLSFNGELGVVCKEYRAFADYVLHSPNVSHTALWYNASSISDAMVSCGDWSETALGDRHFAIITGNRAEIIGFAELWLKVQLPNLEANNISAAHLFIKGGARGEGSNFEVYDAPSNWTEDNITCAGAPADPHSNTSYPIQMRFSSEHHYGWHKFDVTDSLVSQLPYSQELNLRWSAADQDQVPNTWYTTEGHFPPQLLIEFDS